MTELQLDLTFLGSIIILNITITLLYKKYKEQKQKEETKGIDFGNRSSIVYPNSNSFSFMPRVPFLILKQTNDKSLRRIIVIHNVLCVLVYGLFITEIVLYYVKK